MVHKYFWKLKFNNCLELQFYSSTHIAKHIWMLKTLTTYGLFLFHSLTNSTIYNNITSKSINIWINQQWNISHTSLASPLMMIRRNILQQPSVRTQKTTSLTLKFTVRLMWNSPTAPFWQATSTDGTNPEATCSLSPWRCWCSMFNYYFSVTRADSHFRSEWRRRKQYETWLHSYQSHQCHHLL